MKYLGCPNCPIPFSLPHCLEKFGQLLGLSFSRLILYFILFEIVLLARAAREVWEWWKGTYWARNDGLKNTAQHCATPLGPQQMKDDIV